MHRRRRITPYQVSVAFVSSPVFILSHLAVSQLCSCNIRRVNLHPLNLDLGIELNTSLYIMLYF